MVRYEYIWNELANEVRKVSVPDIAPFFTSNELKFDIFEPTTAEEEQEALKWVRKLRLYLDKATEECECYIRVLAQALHELEVQRVKDANDEMFHQMLLRRARDNSYHLKLEVYRSRLAKLDRQISDEAPHGTQSEPLISRQTQPTAEQQEEREALLQSIKYYTNELGLDS